MGAGKHLGNIGDDLGNKDQAESGADQLGKLADNNMDDTHLFHHSADTDAEDHGHACSEHAGDTAAV